MKTMKYFFLLIVKVCLLHYVFCTATYAETLYAKSPSNSDVSATISSARPGDNVVIPAGYANWTSGVVINKELTIRGADEDKTIIASSTNGLALFTVSLTSDVSVDISNIYFKIGINISQFPNIAPKAIYVSGKRDGSFPYTKIRIHHNKFEKGTRVVHISGWVYGVADHNEFLNCNMCVAFDGDNNYSWSRAIEAGTVNAFFIEDNNFTFDANLTSYVQQPIFHQQGARSVTRYNTFDSRTTASTIEFVDNHGNNNLYTGTGKDFRGQPIIEFYNNTIRAGSCYRFADLRGGSNLFHNNTITTEKSSTCPIALREEEGAPTTNIISPPRTKWSAQDQVTNSFFWNNTVNGKPLPVVTWNKEDSIFIQQNRDYFLHEPQGNGGVSTYRLLPGASNIIFLESDPNAYYPYKQYTYPHPLTKGEIPKEEPAINKPSNFRIVN